MQTTLNEIRVIEMNTFSCKKKYIKNRKFHVEDKVYNFKTCSVKYISEKKLFIF